MLRRKPKAKSLSTKTILHVVTGSIATYKIPDLIKMMREEGAQVVCVQTACSKEFVTETVLRTVSGERVYSEMFPKDAPVGVLHTSLADQPDLVLIAPASANLIARLAAGIADDLASCVTLATRKPILIAPAMNDNMYNHPITQRNIAQLTAIGYRFIEPIEGDLACGYVGVGHIAPHQVILDTVIDNLSKKSKRK